MAHWVDRFVYVIRGTRSEQFKIGCTKHVPVRVTAHEQQRREIFDVLAVVRGDFKLEHQLHLAFRAHAMPRHREWFHPTPEILAFVAALPAENRPYLPTRVPAPQGYGCSRRPWLFATNHDEEHRLARKRFAARHGHEFVLPRPVDCTTCEAEHTWRLESLWWETEPSIPRLSLPLDHYLSAARTASQSPALHDDGKAA